MIALATLMLGACASSGGPGSKDYLMASGRWDNTVIVIDVDKALDPANDGTPNARADQPPALPTSTPPAPASSTPWPAASRSQWSCRPTSVVPTSPTIPGKSTPAQAASFQHGWPGTYTVPDSTKATDPANNGTLNAVVTTSMARTSAPPGLPSPRRKDRRCGGAETPDSEDGGRLIGVVDLATNTVVFRSQQAYASLGFPCRYHRYRTPRPNPKIGCFAGTNGMTFSPLGGARCSPPTAAPTTWA